jgi:hypothetical protein
MGASPKIKRVHLKVNQSFESALLGIVSAEPDYKLSLTLNRRLNICLKNVSPVVVPDTNCEKTFSRFSDTGTSPGLIYELISNRSGKINLLKKLKNIDYILQVYDPDNETDTEEIIAILRDTDHITAVFRLDPGTIKDRNLHYLIH